MKVYFLVMNLSSAKKKCVDHRHSLITVSLAYFYAFRCRSTNVTNIPSFGLVMSSPQGNSSSKVCLDATLKLRIMYDKTIFSSSRANR